MKEKRKQHEKQQQKKKKSKKRQKQKQKKQKTETKRIGLVHSFMKKISVYPKFCFLDKTSDEVSPTSRAGNLYKFLFMIFAGLSLV